MGTLPTKNKNPRFFQNNNDIEKKKNVYISSVPSI